MFDKTPLELIWDARLPNGLGGRWYGVYPALVSDIKDPDGQGRVKITLPWSPDTAGGRYEVWARLATLMGGNNRGTWFIPDVNDEVLVAFEDGDSKRPYVLGGLWNGKDKLASKAGDVVSGGKVQKRVLQSRTGHAIWLDDSNGGGGITIKDAKGNSLVISTSDNSLTAEVQGNVTVKAKGNVSVQAQGSVSVEATQAMSLKGMGITIDAGAGQVTVKGTTIKRN